MAYLELNRNPLPSPKRGVTPTVSTLVNSGRNANGVVVAQKIGRDQYKIDNLEFPWLSASEWSRILKILDHFFVHVTFYDPVTNGRKTVRMYVGNRTAEPYWVDDNGKPLFYRNCKFNLIDTGE